MTHSARKPLVAGNWKMHKTVAESVALAHAVAEARVGPRTEVVLAPVFTALGPVAAALRGTNFGVAGQDCHWEPQGAYTGAIAPEMLRDVGCTHCIVGHSERRQYFGETDAGVHRKIVALGRVKLVPIACLGETLAERESGATFSVLSRQLDGMFGSLDAEGADALAANLVVAYEPVWAIGTGRTAKSSDAQLAHAFLRDRLRDRLGDVAERIRILYGGSVKADNAAELMAQPDIDGVLVGGASLDAAGFSRIIQAAGSS